ncbi:MAG TPA: tetratricopeptide repeat protein [Bacteroidota bacterium]|nr:tetratricopeptide repeat protein [Bacteroidota bacterium]
MTHRTYLLLVGTLGLGLMFSLAHAQSVRSLINDGNDLYAERNYTDAEVNYRKALEKDITVMPGHFNLGNALYRQEKFDEAITSYEEAVRKSETPGAKAKAYYNLGDAYIKAQKYDEAIRALIESLKLNPNDADAKYNLSYALMKKREQQNQQSKQNQQDKNQQNQQQQQDKQNQDQQKQDQNKNDQQNHQDKNQQNHQQQQRQQQERMMSRADAERILDVLKNNEKEVQKKLRQRVAGRPRTEKDW